MPNDKLGAEQVNATQAAEVENAGPVLFAKLGVSPMTVEGFDAVGKPVIELLQHLGQTKGLIWDGMQVSITSGGEGGRVGLDAIVRPGDFVQIAENIENN